MSGFSFDIVHTAVSYWQGALSEPVLIVGRNEMKQAAAQGALVWDVRSAEEFQRGHEEGALSLGGVDWLLADNFGGNLIPACVIEDQLRQGGIVPGRPVIIYAEQRAVDAFVALRALRSIGISDAQVCLGDAATRSVQPAELPEHTDRPTATAVAQTRADGGARRSGATQIPALSQPA
ncbi:MAG: hypothetical protein H0T52_01185 [Lautropia sp.]|nr:hypothetical protein [Lautropia sp.]